MQIDSEIVFILISVRERKRGGIKIKARAVNVRSDESSK